MRKRWNRAESRSVNIRNLLRLVAPLWSDPRREVRVFDILEPRKMTHLNIWIYDVIFGLLFTSSILSSNGEIKDSWTFLGTILAPKPLPVCVFVWIRLIERAIFLPFSAPFALILGKQEFWTRINWYCFLLLIFFYRFYLFQKQKNLMNRLFLDLRGNDQKNMREKNTRKTIGPQLAPFCHNFEQTNIFDKNQ